MKPKKILAVLSATLLPFFLFFIIIISSVAGGEGENRSHNEMENSNVSKEVLAYTSVISQYAQKYNVAEYVPLIQAVMMQESGGRGNDPMQSSEGSFNKKFDHKPNAITDPIYSIECGIQELKSCLEQAKVKGTYDIENIYLALQGYNFGNGYIKWAVENYGGYSQANAQMFSEKMRAKLGWSRYGDVNYVPHVMRYYTVDSLDDEANQGEIVKGKGSPKGEMIAKMALTKLGCPYLWGASGPNKFDCSGLVYWAHYQCGVKFERTDTKHLARMGKAVQKDNLSIGDIILFSNNNKLSGVHHVGIYIGGGKMVHAPETGKPVQTKTIKSGYYADQYYCARRLY